MISIDENQFFREPWFVKVKFHKRKIKRKELQMSIQTGTVKLHRVFKTSPEKIYRAFLEADGLSPSVIPTEMCYLGWQESLVQLAMLVEPEIPN